MCNWEENFEGSLSKADSHAWCGTHSVIFLNDVLKIPIVNQMISAQKMIYNIFGSGIYHKPHSIFKSKSQDFQKINIGLFSGNETRMAGYFMGMHRDLKMRKVLQSTISSSEFLSIPTITKFTKAVNYIHDDKIWERCCALIKILCPCIRFLHQADSNLVGIDKLYYYSRMTKQCIEKTKLDLNYHRVFLKYHHMPIYGSRLMTKVMKMSQQYQHQRIKFCILKIYFMSYATCGIKVRNISILTML